MYFHLFSRNKSSSDKDLYKYLVNSVSEKTTENVEKRWHVKLGTHWKNSPGTFGTRTLIRPLSLSRFSQKNLIQLSQVSVFYNKLLYEKVGVLNISKSIIFNLLNNCSKSRYGNNVSLCWTDTDALIWDIHKDKYKTLKKITSMAFREPNFL